MSKTLSQEQRAVALHHSDLALGLSGVISRAPECGVEEIQIVLPDLPFLKSLCEFDSTHKAVNTVLEAWSIGLKTVLVVHQQLIPLLSADRLGLLPMTIRDHKGLEVYWCDKPWLNYRDVALYANCWLVTRKDVRLTDLANEHLQEHQVSLACLRR
ncbi:PduM family microcompartment protein [Vibrio astriarenae]|uniref:PduM family microcompartment protein n=1 Tax=Vibrio astriarenae TaxID=1481923 RepID=UPI003736CCE8